VSSEARGARPLRLAHLADWTRSATIDDIPALCATVRPGQQYLREAEHISFEGGSAQWRGVFALPTRAKASSVFGYWDDSESECFPDVPGGEAEFEVDSRATTVAGHRARIYSVRNVGPVGGIDYLVVQHGRRLWYGAYAGEFGHDAVFTGIEDLEIAYGVDTAAGD
jgi:hypothetical protein